MPKKTEEIVALPTGAEELHAFSRFFWQDLYLDGNKKFWGTWKPVAVPSSPSDTYFTVTEAMAGRLDLISYEFYQTPELWWLLAEVNDIFFPPEEVVVGLMLRVPSFSVLATLGIIR